MKRIEADIGRLGFTVLPMCSVPSRDMWQTRDQGLQRETQTGAAPSLQACGLDRFPYRICNGYKGADALTDANYGHSAGTASRGGCHEAGIQGFADVLPVCWQYVADLNAKRLRTQTQRDAGRRNPDAAGCWSTEKEDRPELARAGSVVASFVL